MPSNCNAGGLLKVPQTARISNQSILREINPEYLLERLMLKLKLQYFGHLMQTDDSLEKSLMLGKIKAPGPINSWQIEGENVEAVTIFLF